MSRIGLLQLNAISGVGYLKSKKSSVIDNKLLCNKMQLNMLPINHGQLRTLTNTDSSGTARTCLRPHPADHPRYVPPAASCPHRPPLLTTRLMCAIYLPTVSDYLFKFPSSALDLILSSSALAVSLPDHFHPCKHVPWTLTLTNSSLP